MYGAKINVKSVDKLRLNKFFAAYKPKKKTKILAVKDVNAMSMPPCFSVLYQQILRDCLISNSWLQAYRSDPPFMEPRNYGCDPYDGKYFPKWHEGDATPSSIDSITIMNEEEELEDEDLSHYNSDEDESDGEDECDDSG